MDQNAGITAAFHGINKAGGIHGRELRLVMKDDGYVPAKSVENIKQMLDGNSVFAFMSCIGTANNAAIIPLIEQAGVPYVGPVTGASSLRQPGQRNVFHVRASYTDEVTRDGSIADLRLAAASRLSRRIALGAGLHLLAGSTRETAERRFDDTSFHTVQQLAEVRYSGVGVSGSLLLGVAPGLSVTGWVRADSRLRATVADTTSADTDLPRMAGGGMLFSPSPSVRFGGAVAWRGWARAGAGAFDTWSWSAGAEIGAGHMPLRFGVRGGQLPFGPGPTAPTEFAAAAGTGRAFAQGRALLDVGVERLERRGGGLTERVWTALVGITVRP